MCMCALYYLFAHERAAAAVHADAVYFELAYNKTNPAIRTRALVTYSTTTLKLIRCEVWW